MTDLTKTYSSKKRRVTNKLPKAKLDETVEVYAHLAVDPRKSDQMVRGTFSFLTAAVNQKRDCLH